MTTEISNFVDENVQSFSKQNSEDPEDTRKENTLARNRDYGGKNYSLIDTSSTHEKPPPFPEPENLNILLKTPFKKYICLIFCIFGVIVIVSILNVEIQKHPTSPVEELEFSLHDISSTNLSELGQGKQEANLTDFNIILKEPTLKSLCDSTTWHPNLYLNCTNIRNKTINERSTVDARGTVNLRNSMITCLRWAIDAGMGFVIPRIALRSEEMPIIFDRWTDFEFLFDEGHLRRTMNNECPQMKIIKPDSKVDNVVISVSQPYYHYFYGNYSKWTLNLLEENGISMSSTRVNEITTIWEDQSLFGWDFKKELVDIEMKLRSAVVYNSFIYSLSSDLANLIKVDYLGLHLRVEEDFRRDYNRTKKWVIWSQRNRFPNITTLYVATGDKPYEDLFRDEMAKYGITVISKFTLAASNHELSERLAKCNFDQLGAIDLPILKNSYHFFGNGLSSLTYATAYDRGGGYLLNCKCDIQEEVTGVFVCCY